MSNKLGDHVVGLGVPIQWRPGQGLGLTAEGKRLLARAQINDREARRMVDEAQNARGTAGGTLHVGFGPTPTALLLRLVGPDFHARLPTFRLKLTSGFYEHLRPPLQQGLIEVAVTAMPHD